MGLLDAIYILDNEYLPVLHFPLTNTSIGHSIPPIIVSNSIASSNNENNSNSSSNNNNKNSNFILIDNNTILVWCLVDRVYFAVTGEIRPSTIDVVSDDEEEEEEDDDEVSSNSDSNSDNNYEESLNAKSVKQPKIKNYIANSYNPLQYISFLEILVDATKLMLQTSILSPHKIQINSHRIIMLLQELVDASVPFIIDLNQLRELLPNDSIIDKIVSATKQIQNNAASSISNIKNVNISSPSLTSVSGNSHNNNFSRNSNTSTFKYSTILEKSGNPIPWRKIDIKNIQNEIFLDLYESIDIIVTPSINNNKQKHKSKKHNKYTTNGSSFFNSNNDYFINNECYQKATIHGHMNLTTSLSDNPILDIQLNIPSIFNLNNCYPSLHKSINKSIWKNSNGKSIQLIPPDEKCKLLSYNIDLIELNHENEDDLNINKYIGLINVQLIKGLGIKMNEFEISIDTGNSINSNISNNGSSSSVLKDIKDLSIEIILPDTSNLLIDSNKLEKNVISSNNFNDKDNLNNYNNKEYGSKDSISNDNTNLKVLRNSTGTIIRTETGNYEWKFDSDIVVGGKFTLRASVSDDDDNDDTNDGNDVNNDNHNNKSLLFPKFLKVKYKHYGSVPSGIKVKSINLIDSVNPKPFKGVKYISSSGDYIIR